MSPTTTNLLHYKRRRRCFRRRCRSLRRRLQPKDRFDCLPDALVIEIFNKVSTAKSLFRCCAVCKRFASLVPQTDTIFFPVNLQKNPTSENPSSPLSDEAPPDAVDGLNKFAAIRSLEIEMHCDFPSRGAGDSLIRYRAVMMGTDVKIAMAVLSLSFLGREQSSRITISPDLHDIVKEKFLKITRRLLSVMWAQYDTLRRVISNYPTLVNVAIGDKGKQVQLRIRREGTTKSRNCIEEEVNLESPPDPDVNGAPLGAKVWYSPMVELPSCGFAMELPVVMVIRPKDEEIVMEKDIGLMVGAFGEDEDGKAIDELLNIVKLRVLKVKRDDDCSRIFELDLSEEEG